MLLMTTDKFSEFDRICVDQGLNFVFESHAILHGMPSNSFMVFTSGIDIVPFGYGSILGLAGMIKIPLFWIVWGTTLYKTLEVNGTPWSFFFVAPGTT